MFTRKSMSKPSYLLGLILLGNLVGCSESNTFSPAKIKLATSQPATATAPAMNPYANMTGLKGEKLKMVYPGVTNISSVPIMNPNKGWAIYSWGQMATGVSPLVQVCSSVVYLRIDWSDLEGDTEGKFNWEIIDNTITNAAATGKKTAFRIMGLNPHSEREFTFPKWIVQGHESDFYLTTINLEGTLKPRWFPKDPNTSERWKYACKHLATELGKRYNNNPNIAFVEVGSIGDWGEQISNYAPTNQMLKQLPWREHLSWYEAAFPNTPLISVAAGQDHMDFAWQDAHRFGRRTDGFCAPPVKEDTTDGAYQDGRVIAASFNSRQPSFLEFPPGTDPSAAKRNFWWGTFWNGIIELGKPTYLGTNFGAVIGNYMAQNFPYRLIESANRTGYHLVLERAGYTPELIAGKGDSGTLAVTFRNDGCRFPDYPIYLSCALLDAQDHVIEQVWCDDVQLKDHAEPWVKYQMINNYSGKFIPAIPKTYMVKVPVKFAATPEAKHLAVGLFTDKKLPEPNILLGNTGVGSTGWYSLDQYPNKPQADAYPSLHDLAMDKQVFVSGTATGTTTNLTDDNITTGWSSPAKPNQWLIIDMGNITTFHVLMLDWQDKFPKSYRVETSMEGDIWVSQGQTNNNQGGISYLSLPDTKARFIKISADDNNGLSLYEVEVLGSSPNLRPPRRR